jgi:hypothetical protein
MCWLKMWKPIIHGHDVIFQKNRILRLLLYGVTYYRMSVRHPTTDKFIQQQYLLNISYPYVFFIHLNVPFISFVHMVLHWSLCIGILLICVYKIWNLVLLLQHKYAQNMLGTFPITFIGSDHLYRSDNSFSECHLWLSSIFNWAMSNGRFHFYYMGKLFSVYAVFYGTCSLVCNSVCFW